MDGAVQRIQHTIGHHDANSHATTRDKKNPLPLNRHEELTTISIHYSDMTFCKSNYTCTGTCLVNTASHSKRPPPPSPQLRHKVLHRSQVLQAVLHILIGYDICLHQANAHPNFGTKSCTGVKDFKQYYIS